MKPLVLIVSAVLMLFSCTGVYYPPIDTTSPEIISIHTSPATVVAGREFSVIVQVYDAESFVTVTYDMDGNGVFDDFNWSEFLYPGNKTLTVKAESAGGVTEEYYNFYVESVALDLSVTFSAVADDSNGDFQLNYTIQNVSNVPIFLTGKSFGIYDSNRNPIIDADIGIEQEYLLVNSYLAVNGSTNALLQGYSMELIPYYYSITLFYDDGLGSSTSEVYLGGFFHQ